MLYEVITNFLLWQLAYTELYFTDMLWPEFGAEAFDKALSSFRARERRFGRTSEQLLPIKGKGDQLVGSGTPGNVKTDA